MVEFVWNIKKGAISEAIKEQL